MLSIKSAMLHNGLTTPSFVMAEGAVFRHRIPTLIRDVDCRIVTVVDEYK